MRTFLRRGGVLIYPIPPAPRTAVLVAGFRSKGRVRVFERGWTEAAARFAPQSIAARLEQIDKLEGIAHPTHALIVLRTSSDSGLTLENRRRLWQAFQVPVFEQIISVSGTLLAAECEAHCGLHIESRDFTADDHLIDRTPCACGRKSPRLIVPQPAAWKVAASGKRTV